MKYLSKEQLESGLKNDLLTLKKLKKQYNDIAKTIRVYEEHIVKYKQQLTKMLSEETNKPKYLVRPDDSHIWELDESNNCYRSYSSIILYSDGTRQNAQPHFTFENLTVNYGFFAISEDEIEKYTKKFNLYYKWLAWSCRSDGHGGTKGGTMEEYIERFGDGDEEKDKTTPKCTKPDDFNCSRPWGGTCRDLRCEYFK